MQYATFSDTALALTDNGNLFGAIEFYQACRNAQIKPILGLNAYCAATSRLEPSGGENPTYQLTLLVAIILLQPSLRKEKSPAGNSSPD